MTRRFQRSDALFADSTARKGRLDREVLPGSAENTAVARSANPKKRHFFSFHGLELKVAADGQPPGDSPRQLYDWEIGLAKPCLAPDGDPEVGDDAEQQLDFRRVSRLKPHRPALDRDSVCDHRPDWLTIGG